MDQIIALCVIALALASFPAAVGVAALQERRAPARARIRR